MLLLGVTAVSLLTTPMVIMATNRLLRDLSLGDMARRAAMLHVHHRPPGSMSLGSIKGELLAGGHRDSFASSRISGFGVEEGLLLEGGQAQQAPPGADGLRFNGLHLRLELDAKDWADILGGREVGGCACMHGHACTAVAGRSLARAR